MKKITSLVLALVLSLSLSVTAFASELPTESSNEVVTTITIADENGNDVQYELRKDTVTDIPAKGTGSLFGTYSVLGYENAHILEGFSW